MHGNRKQLSLPSRKQHQSMKKSFCFNPQFTDGKVRNSQIHVSAIMLEICDRDRDFMDPWTQCFSPKVIIAVHWEQWSLQMFAVQQKDFHWKLWAPLRTKSWFLHTNTALTGLCCISFSCHHLPTLKSLQMEVKQLQTPLWKTLVFLSLKFKLQHPRRPLLNLNKESTLHSEPGSFHSLSQCFVSFSISYIYIYNLYI